MTHSFNCFLSAMAERFPDDRMLIESVTNQCKKCTDCIMGEAVNPACTGATGTECFEYVKYPNMRAAMMIDYDGKPTTDVSMAVKCSDTESERASLVRIVHDYLTNDNVRVEAQLRSAETGEVVFSYSADDDLISGEATHVAGVIESMNLAHPGHEALFGTIARGYGECIQTEGVGKFLAAGALGALLMLGVSAKGCVPDAVNDVTKSAIDKGGELVTDGAAYALNKGADAMSYAADKISGKAGEAVEKAGEVKDAAVQKASDATDGISRADIGKKVKEVTNSAVDKVTSAGKIIRGEGEHAKAAAAERANAAKGAVATQADSVKHDAKTAAADAKTKTGNAADKVASSAATAGKNVAKGAENGKKSVSDMQKQATAGATKYTKHGIDGTSAYHKAWADAASDKVSTGKFNYYKASPAQQKAYDDFQMKKLSDCIEHGGDEQMCYDKATDAAIQHMSK